MLTINGTAIDKMGDAGLAFVMDEIQAEIAKRKQEHKKKVILKVVEDLRALRTLGMTYCTITDGNAEIDLDMQEITLWDKTEIGYDEYVI